MGVKSEIRNHKSETEGTVSLFDVPFDRVTQKSALELIQKRLRAGTTTRIVTINPEFLVEAEKNAEFKQVLQTADLHLADGIGIIWASHLMTRITNDELRITNWLGLRMKIWWSLIELLVAPQKFYNPLPERVTGSDLFLPLMDLLATEKQSVFLLGAAPGVAETVAEKLRITNCELRIAGTYVGSPKDEESKHIIKLINESGAQALFVAFQFPKQDIWIAEYLKQMPNVKVAIGVGGTFDFIAGTAHKDHSKKAKRAPLFLQKLHLEWFWRLITQPYRWKRIYNATFKFIDLVYTEAKRNQNLGETDSGQR